MSKPIDPEVLEQIEAARRSMPPEEYARRLEGARKSVLAEVEAFMPAFEELGVKVVCVDSSPTVQMADHPRGLDLKQADDAEL